MVRALLPILAALLGGAQAQWLTRTPRPEHPATPREGCTPGQLVAASCPVRMECLADANFPRGGRCDCNPLWFKYAGKLPFDDSEWDDGFDAGDCESHHLSRFLFGMLNLAGIVLMAAFLYTDVVVIKELHRVKALKWNAVTYSLCYLIWAGVGILCYNVIYLANSWGADKDEYWYFSRGVLFTFFLRPPIAVMDFEIAVTWIDLYDRTSKMTKKSSRAIRALRVFLRLVAFADAVGFGTWMVITGSTLTVLIGQLSPLLLGGICNAIGGYFIIQTLCPSRKDVTNPNWKVTEAIRRACKHSLGGKAMEVAALVGLIATARHPQVGYMYSFFAFQWSAGFILGKFGWLQYLIYASRKHLKRFADERSSSYFGFARIPLSRCRRTDPVS